MDVAVGSAVVSLPSVDVDALSQAARVDALIEVQRARAWMDAAELRLLAALAEPGEISPRTRLSAAVVAKQYVREEIACALRVAPVTVNDRLHVARTAVADLPSLLGALERGQTTVRHVRSVVEALDPLEHQARVGLDAELVGPACTQTPSRFRQTVARAVLAADPRGADARHEQARAGRSVRFMPAADGMGVLRAEISAQDLAAVGEVVQAAADHRPAHLDRCAWAAAEHARRTAPETSTTTTTTAAGETTRTATTTAASTEGEAAAGETAAAAGEAVAGETAAAAGEAVAGETAAATGEAAAAAASGTAELADASTVGDGGDRDLLDPACPGCRRILSSPDQRRADALVGLLLGLDIATVATQHGRAPTVQISVALSTLLEIDDQPGELAGYGPVPAQTARRIATDPSGTWRRLLTDPTGRLLDYGRSTYRPPQDLTDHIIARDVHCRFPGCGRRARTSELDHLQPWADGGPTADHNILTGCPRHHHLRHDAGWTVTGDPRGTLTWTTPTGHSYNDPTGTHPIDTTSNTSRNDNPSTDPDPPPF